MATAAVAAGTGPISVAVDGSGKYAYVANNSNNNVSQYTIGANGALTLMGTVTTGTQPFAVTVDPSGQFAYVANAGSSNVSQYSIGANGVLTPLSPSTIAAGTQPSSIVTTGTWQ